MRLTLAGLAKYYISCFGLTNFIHVFSILGFLSTTSPPLPMDSWWLHIVIFLTCMVLPIVAVLADNYVLYVTVATVSLARTLAEAFGVFVWSADLYIMLAPLCALAAIFSLILAVEKVAFEVSAEILSLRWSQF